MNNAAADSKYISTSVFGKSPVIVKSYFVEHHLSQQAWNGFPAEKVEAANAQ